MTWLTGEKGSNSRGEVWLSAPSVAPLVSATRACYAKRDVSTATTCLRFKCLLLEISHLLVCFMIKESWQFPSLSCLASSRRRFSGTGVVEPRLSLPRPVRKARHLCKDACWYQRQTPPQLNVAGTNVLQARKVEDSVG